METILFENGVALIIFGALSLSASAVIHIVGNSLFSETKKKKRCCPVVTATKYAINKIQKKELNPIEEEMEEKYKDF